MSVDLRELGTPFALLYINFCSTDESLNSTNRCRADGVVRGLVGKRLRSEAFFSPLLRNRLDDRNGYFLTTVLVINMCINRHIKLYYNPMILDTSLLSHD